MSFLAYNQNIPNPPNNPSADVGPMQINTNSNFSIWDVDHFGFNNNNGGQHEQTSFPSFSTGTLPIPVAGNQQSVAYPAAGSADATRAQYYFKNQANTFPLSAIKAFATFKSLGADGNITADNSFNVSGPIVQTHSGINGIYNVPLSVDFTASSNKAVVFVLSPTLNFAATSYTLSGSTLTIRTLTFSSGAIINFIILQI